MNICSPYRVRPIGRRCMTWYTFFYIQFCGVWWALIVHLVLLSPWCMFVCLSLYALGCPMSPWCDVWVRFSISGGLHRTLEQMPAWDSFRCSGWCQFVRVPVRLCCGCAGVPDITDIESRMRMTLPLLFMRFPRMRNVIAQYPETDIRYRITIGIVRRLKLLLFFQTRRNLRFKLEHV